MFTDAEEEHESFHCWNKSRGQQNSCKAEKSERVEHKILVNVMHLNGI